MVWFRLFCSFIVLIGATLPMAAAWDLADIMMAIMCMINLPACVALSNVAVKACKDYEKQKKAGKNPVFHAADVGLNPDDLDYWK
jgi:AGCS family alanine or glycine:cation symporter